MVGQVNHEPVEAVRDRRTGRTPRRVGGPEHEVIDEDLRALPEEVRQRAAPLVGLESILLVGPNPWQFLPSPALINAAATGPLQRCRLVHPPGLSLRLECFLYRHRR
jgi:hypothetical protein